MTIIVGLHMWQNNKNHKSIIYNIKQNLRMLYIKQWLNHIENNNKIDNFDSKYKLILDMNDILIKLNQ